MINLLFVGVLEELLVQWGMIHALPYVTPVNWGDIGGQFLVYFFSFDLYYYLLHRFVLHGRFGWWSHREHHSSYVCTPSTGFSFNWFEGIVTGGFAPFLAHALSFDSRTLVVCKLYGFVSTVIQHAGLQIFPSWWDTHPVTRLYLSPQAS